MYKLSDNIIIKEIKSDLSKVFCYHSIFGNAIVVDKNKFYALKDKKNFDLIWLNENLSNDEIEFLSSNHYILLEDLDEQNIVDKKLSNREKELKSGSNFNKLQLILTNSCNFNCKYCFCESFKKEKTMENRSTMSWELADFSINESIKILKKNGNTHLIVSFFGGEPTLSIDVMEKVLNKFKNNYDGISIEYECTSNGSIMTKNLAKLFAKYSVSMSISIDYLSPDTLEYRADGGNNIPWTTIDKNIKLMANEGVLLEISAVLSQETYNENFYNLVDYASKNSIETIYLILSFDPEFYKVFTAKEVSKKVIDYYHYANNRGVSLEGYWYETFSLIIDHEKFSKQEAHKTCPTIGKMLSIEPNGDAFSCKTTKKVLGNIRNLDDIFRGDNYKYYGMRAYVNSETCIGCELQGFCSGNCTGANENNLDSIYSVDNNYCLVVKEVVNNLIDNYINS